MNYWNDFNQFVIIVQLVTDKNVVRLLIIWENVVPILESISLNIQLNLKIQKIVEKPNISSKIMQLLTIFIITENCKVESITALRSDQQFITILLQFLVSNVNSL